MNLLSHLLPVVITSIILLISYMFFRYKDTMHHIALVAEAGTIDGQTALAKYLAAKAGGTLVETKQAWVHFVPAAKELHRLHQIKSGMLAVDM